MDEITIYAQTQPQVERGPKGQWIITFKGSYALHQRTVEQPPASMAAPPSAPVRRPSEGEKSLPRMRTLPQAVKEIRENDPNTSITYQKLRRWVLDGRIPSFDGGKCRYVDLNDIGLIMEGGGPDGKH